MTRPDSRVLAFAHIGDLHVREARAPNVLDLLSIALQIETQASGQLDFVVIPGDCAENGLPDQYALIAAALRTLSLPVHLIPGDHDMEQGTLANFYAGLGAPRLPAEARLPGHRCLFLDLCGAGTGGPDFRLGASQLDWLEARLQEATSATETPLVFMHSYPADLRDPAEAARLAGLLREHRVALADMGHTHYNELANDGTTVFAATRSTGQIEEGPVGYSIATVRGGVVSWRFRALDDPFPFVMITAPADIRLRRDGVAAADGEDMVRARVFGREAVVRVEARLDDGPWRPMRRNGDGMDWHAPLPTRAGRLCDLAVRALTRSGRPGFHAVRIAGPDHVPPVRAAGGSDSCSVGPWPENGILGTQLGPNRNGRKW